VANQDFTRSLTDAKNCRQQTPTTLNLLEFGFARTLGKHYAGAASALRQRAYKRNQMMPKLAEGALEPTCSHARRSTPAGATTTRPSCARR